MALILCECRWGLYIKINCDRDAWKEKMPANGEGRHVSLSGKTENNPDRV